MTTPTYAELDAFALEMEELLRQQCAARGVEFLPIRNRLFAKWLGDKPATEGNGK